MPGADRLTIFELGTLYGVAPRSLAFFEDQGLLSPIVEDGTKYYLAKDRIKLELILKGRKLGFSLLELKLLILTTEEERAFSDLQAEDSKPVSRSIGAEDVPEQIWQAERQIEHLRARIQDLYAQLTDGKQVKDGS